MSGAVVTLNAGSSSVKFAVFRAADGVLETAPALKGQISGVNSRPALEISVDGAPPEKRELSKSDVPDHAAALDLLMGDIEQRLGDETVLAVGHRVVHGGLEFSAPLALTDDAVARLATLTPLAPGHQPHNLNGVAVARRHWPDAPHVACFDTAFHRGQPHVAEQFALPRALTEEGIIRYGFHGLSYEYIAGAAPQIMGDAPHERMIVAHLGAGASMCAMKNGKSVTTTMGFTALDGLPMGTRCGDVDPGVLLYLLEEKGVTVSELTDCLYKQSGLLGISGISPDMRVLEASDDPRAEEAIAYFVHRCVREIGALAAALGGVDALVFTAGVGENAVHVRARILEGCAWLGARIDEDANAAHGPRITAEDSRLSAWAVPTNEELMIARHAFGLIQS